MTPPPTEKRKSIKDLLAIMEALRTPETGCPWDLEQTFATIAPYTIEEAYEVADAIERGDMAALEEELGDLLLQVVYHAQMAREDGRFGFDSVVDGICQKMIRRHPHVFGDAAERAAVDLDGLWERLKGQEKARKQTSGVSRGVLEGVPRALPALVRAIKLQDKAARVGFDWPSMEPVFEKIREETAELEHAVSHENPNREKIAEEFGDLLFVLANLGRHLHIDPEDALRRANAKFVRRFEEIERMLAARGKTPEGSDLEEMDRLWDEVKRREETRGS
ncbi:MAG: nucleoside triphosphate pyrophosphohydrolase [Proteobacteria bacterium]|nr:nucleoside triphosphate pyrophosphohydrolase [Pseudomonadota bacterium]